MPTSHGQRTTQNGRRLRGLFASVVVLASATLVQPATAAEQSTPPWAYPVLAPGYKIPPDDGTARHVPDSKAAFTLTQLRDLFNAYDWFPEDHPAMPEIVVHGRKP